MVNTLTKPQRKAKKIVKECEHRYETTGLVAIKPIDLRTDTYTHYCQSCSKQFTMADIISMGF